MRTKTLSAIEKLKSQQAKLAARIQAMEARAKVSERKQETRRKILIGAYYWDAVKKNGEMELLKQQLDGYLTRDSDRTLFELPPLQQKTKTKITNAASAAEELATSD